LVQWVLLDCWFVGCCLLFVWFNFARLRTWACSWTCWCLLLVFVYFNFAGLGSCMRSWSCFFLLCGVQVLHPQFDLRFCRSSFRSKFRCHNFIYICSLLFIVCSLQVRMFDYFYWHARHMFRVPFVLGLQFGNHWRYMCCLLVQWLLLVRWFVGLLLVTCCCLAQVCKFEVLGLQLGMFMLAPWFVVCCFLLFASTLQGWGPMPAVGIVLFALCGVQVLHPQVDLWFSHLSCLAKSRSGACPVPAYHVLKFCSNSFFYLWTISTCLCKMFL
jgi:hypothetical protein